MKDKVVVKYITALLLIGSNAIVASHILPAARLSSPRHFSGVFFSIGQPPVQTVAILGYLETLSALFFAAAFLGKLLNSL
jgi:hypothetical protein